MVQIAQISTYNFSLAVVVVKTTIQFTNLYPLRRVLEFILEVKEIIEKTENQKNFIGTKIEDGDKYLLVTNSYKKGNNVLFSVECSICSADTELFPEREMLISKNNLKQGKKPCKCSSGWKPSKYQYEILVRRYAINVGDTIKSISGKGIVQIYSEGYGYWEIPANDYIKGKRGISEAKDIKNSKLRLPDKTHYDRFLSTGVFIEGTYFWRSDRVDTRGYSVYWKYYCPICSNDEYVQNGLCDGVFEAVGGTLKKGNRSCRCSNTYRWTQDQREYQINEICKEENLTFIGWSENYKGSFTKFDWICSHDHKNTTCLSNFLHLNHRCSTCAENLWGYYKERKNDTDTLYLLKFYRGNEMFYKIGRTFKANDRFGYFKKFYNVDIISTVEDIHDIIYPKELYFKALLEMYHYLPEQAFDGSLEECFTSDILNVPEIISTFNLKELNNDLQC